jgi:AraC-like DNA-binding protein
VLPTLFPGGPGRRLARRTEVMPKNVRVDRVGYTDDGAFRRLFKKHTNMSPREYRLHFGAIAEG